MAPAQCTILTSRVHNGPSKEQQDMDESINCCYSCFSFFQSFQVQPPTNPPNSYPIKPTFYKLICKNFMGDFVKSHLKVISSSPSFYQSCGHFAPTYLEVQCLLNGFLVRTGETCANILMQTYLIHTSWMQLYFRMHIAPNFVMRFSYQKCAYWRKVCTKCIYFWKWCRMHYIKGDSLNNVCIEQNVF